MGKISNEFIVMSLRSYMLQYFMKSIIHEKANCRKKGLSRIVSLFPSIVIETVLRCNMNMR